MGTVCFGGPGGRNGERRTEHVFGVGRRRIFLTVVKGEAQPSAGQFPVLSNQRPSDFTIPETNSKSLNMAWANTE